MRSLNKIGRRKSYVRCMVREPQPSMKVTWLCLHAADSTDILLYKQRHFVVLHFVSFEAIKCVLILLFVLCGLRPKGPKGPKDPKGPKGQLLVFPPFKASLDCSFVAKSEQ